MCVCLCSIECYDYGAAVLLFLKCCTSSRKNAIGPYSIDKRILLGLHPYDFGIGVRREDENVRGLSCLRVQISLYNNYPVNLRHSMPRTSRNVFVTSTSLFIAHWSLLIAHCSLLIAHCSLLIARCSLLVARPHSVILFGERYGEAHVVLSNNVANTLHLPY